MNNMVIVTGNVVSDPVMRTTSTGYVVTKVRVASDDRRLNPATQEWETVTTSFYDVSCWRLLGERVSASIRRGDPVFFSGRVRVKEFSRENGHPDHAVEVDADVFGPDLRRVTVTVNRKPRAIPTPVEPEQPSAAPTPDVEPTVVSEPAA